MAFVVIFVVFRFKYNKIKKYVNGRATRPIEMAQTVAAKPIVMPRIFESADTTN